VSKKASELWRNLPAEERSHWNKEAAKEKKRYIAEKELYTGPVSRILFDFFAVDASEYCPDARKCVVIVFKFCLPRH
jgi:hypothetical protein